MGRRIEKLTIYGFKSIRELDSFALSDLNVLIGGNGSGKSNFVDFFRLLREMAEGRLQLALARQGGAQRCLFLGSETTKQIRANLRFGENGYTFQLVPTAGDALAFQDERIEYEGDLGRTRSVDRSIGSGQLESKLREQIDQDTRNRSISEYIHRSISRWRVYHFHDTSDTAGMKRPSSVQDYVYLRGDASNLSAFIHWFREHKPDEYQYLRKTIRLVIPFFDDFRLEPKELPSGEEQVTLIWCQRGSDYPFWPSQLSDGSLRFICLATALLQPYPPSTIIIDEPELGLHPHAISVLASLLRKASKRMQIVISTQSVPLVSQFEPEDLIVVDREDDASIFKRLEAKELSDWLEDYTLGDLWEKNILGGGPLS